MIDCRRCDCGCGATRKMGCCIKEAEMLAAKDAEIARLKNAMNEAGDLILEGKPATAMISLKAATK